MIQWSEVKQEFIYDGALMDICFYDTNIEDWQQFLGIIQSMGLEFKYFHDGKPNKFSWNAVNIFDDRKHSHEFVFKFNGIEYYSHFFTTEEIELDISPVDIKSQKTLDSLINFIEQFGKQLSKTVALTPENAHEIPIFIYHNGSSSIEYIQTT